MANVVLMLHIYFAGPYSSFIPPILQHHLIMEEYNISSIFCPNSFFKLHIPTIIAKLDVVYTFGLIGA